MLLCHNFSMKQCVSKSITVFRCKYLDTKLCVAAPLCRPSSNPPQPAVEANSSPGASHWVTRDTIGTSLGGWQSFAGAQIVFWRQIFRIVKTKFHRCVNVCCLIPAANYCPVTFLLHLQHHMFDMI